MARFIFYDNRIINILLKEEKPSGGAAVQAYGWIRGLLAEGQEVVVLTHLSKNGAIKEDCRDIKLIPLYQSKKGIRWLRWVYYRLPYIYRTIKHIRPDYVYEGIPCWSSFVFALICRQLKVKYILRISSDSLLDDRIYQRRSKLHLFFQTLGMRLSQCILCQNEYQFDLVKKKFPGKKVFKIPNPIFVKNNVSATDSSSRHYIAWLGLFQYQKNLPLLFEIASVLKEEMFWIAGKEHEGCDEQTLSSLHKLKQLPNVRFVGFLERDQVLPYLAKAKFLLNTSHYEGFSNTFLEAMSVGTPIITSENVNPDHIITKHKLGIVYKNVPDLQHQY
ncbi:MAG: glycosyltransferase family 4 protein, partial [Flavisolibacter sp.]|nr:glycosyltransferase family 4 protein [Flavisolibacter sp.]